MKIIFKRIKDLRFSIFILLLIAFASSIGSIIEQDQEKIFYEENYSGKKAIYGLLDSKLIFFFKFDHLYDSWWFITLLSLLALSLAICTFENQLPLVVNSKKLIFSKKFGNKESLCFNQKSFFEIEDLIKKLQKCNFYIYQKNHYIYAYKGLIGRLSPIFVHISLLLLLFASSLSAFANFKAQEIIPKGEISHIQNLLKIGKLTKLDKINIRLNDFWINYQEQKLHQFYSNISLLNNYGEEKVNKSISVNQPLFYKDLAIYQSDWKLNGLRIKDISRSLSFRQLPNQLINIKEYPLFSLKGNLKKEKIWLTWLQIDEKKAFTLVFDELRNDCLIYNEKGKFLQKEEVSKLIKSQCFILEILKSSGFLIKYDPMITIIYIGFGSLILSTFLAFLPHQKISIYYDSKFYKINTFKARKLFLSKKNTEAFINLKNK